MGTGQTHRTIILLLLAGLLLPALACGWLSPEYQVNNQVRLAAYRYERDTRGKTDDLVIHFNRTESRIRFAGQSENGGRTVWLFDLAVREYFDMLPAGRTFLYLQRPQFNSNYTKATLEEYRGSKNGYVSRELTLRRGENGDWTVANDLELSQK